MNCSSKEKPNIKQIILITACVFVSMLFCAGNTSPLYPHYACLDSSMFLLTGKGMLEGKVCYVDLFDHKGPVFFFLESIGCWIGGRTGVWVLQCAFATASVFLLKRICKQISANSLLAVICAASIFFFTFLHGNLTEEFSMPLILLALLLEVRFLASKEKTHNPWYALVYGLIIGLLAFIRLNNAVSVCVLVVCIGVILIKQKQWKNVVTNLLMGALGVAAVALVICYYYKAHGALEDMLYATFWHNFLYAKNATHEAIISKKLFYYIIMYAPGVFAVCAYTKCAKFDNKRLYYSLATATAITYLMLVYSNIYAHYFMLGIPLFAVAVACAFPDFSVKSCRSFIKQNKWMNRFLLIILAIYTLLSVYSAGAPFYKTYITKSANNQYLEISKSMKSIPTDERDSVIGFGVLADFYIHADITPCYKYYTLQSWMTSEERDVYGEFIEYAKTQHPLWIVINKDEQDKGIISVLHEYELITCDNNYKYFRYKG